MTLGVAVEAGNIGALACPEEEDLELEVQEEEADGGSQDALYMVSRGSTAISSLYSRRTITRSSTQASILFDFADPTLHRGSRISNILHRGGSVFSDQPATAEYYRLSEIVLQTDAFISHNWSTPRREKFVSLALQFNFVPAMICALIAAVIVFIVQCWCDFIPKTEEVFNEQVTNVGFFCQAVSVTTFIVALFFVHEVYPYLGITGPNVFLDKTCVHQVDETLKQQGIMHLTAFLTHSRSMVVLYSDCYLEKLWTVYEIATFLLLFPNGDLMLQPVFFAKVVIISTAVICLSRIFCALFFLPQTQAFLGFTMHAPEFVGRLIVGCALTPLLLVMAWIFRRWAREMDNIHKRVKDFSITNAACLREQDRLIVEGNVARFARLYEYAPVYSCQADALKSFDTLVRRELPRLLRASLGRVGIPYRYAVAIHLVYIPYALDFISVNLHNDKIDWLGSAGYMLWCFGFAFGVGPLSIAICYLLAKHSNKLKKVKAAVAVVAIVIVCLLLEHVAVQLLNTIYLHCMEGSKAFLTIILFVDVVMIMLAIGIYRRPVWVVRRDDDPKVEGMMGKVSESAETSCSDTSSYQEEDLSSLSDSGALESAHRGWPWRAVVQHDTDEVPHGDHRSSPHSPARDLGPNIP